MVFSSIPSFSFLLFHYVSQFPTSLALYWQLLGQMGYQLVSKTKLARYQTYRISFMQSKQLLGCEGKHLLYIVSCLCRSFKESINLIFLLEFYCSISCYLATILDGQFDEKVILVNFQIWRFFQF